MSEEIKYALESLRTAEGLYVGMLDPEEMESFNLLCKNDLARREYGGAGGLMGLAKVKLTRNPLS